MSTEEKSGAALDHLKEIGKIRIADEAIMMQDVQELLAMERYKARAHNRKFLGGDFEESDMGNIHIGDGNQAAPQSLAPSAPSSFSRKAIAAGLLALGGGGFGAGAMAIYDYLTSDPPPAVESFDTDTEYEMKLIPDGA